jgi:hypothetical protein
MTTLRRAAGTIAVAALLVWSWLDMKTYTGPESLAASRWRVAAFAVMLAGYVAWSSQGTRRGGAP